MYDLTIGGHTIGTTSEHPFFVRGKGWTPAKELQPGDEVRLLTPGWQRVDSNVDTGRTETVYNLEIEGDHTYFVGDLTWGWQVWAHNVECYHYTSLAGVKGMNANRTILAKISMYAAHGVQKAVVFLTPLNPAQLAIKGVKALGITKNKAKHVIPLDIAKDQIKKIPGGKGAYIWYYIGNIPLPKKGPFSIPTGL